MPDEVWSDYRMEGPDLFVYCALASLVFEGKVARASTRWIAEKAHMTQKQAWISLKRLISLGHIKPAETNQPRKLSWYELASEVFGQKQGKVDVVRGGRYVSKEEGVA